MLRDINGYTEPCDATNFDAALTKTLKGDALKSERLAKNAPGAKYAQFYNPAKAPEGSGTEKLLHMTYVF